MSAVDSLSCGNLSPQNRNEIKKSLQALVEKKIRIYSRILGFGNLKHK